MATILAKEWENSVKNFFKPKRRVRNLNLNSANVWVNPKKLTVFLNWLAFGAVYSNWADKSPKYLLIQKSKGERISLLARIIRQEIWVKEIWDLSKMMSIKFK